MQCLNIKTTRRIAPTLKAVGYVQLDITEMQLRRALAVILTLALFVPKATAGQAKPYLCALPHAADGYEEPETWRCNGQLPLWTYNAEESECVEFAYGGCGGNDNSFFTREDCEATCNNG